MNDLDLAAARIFERSALVRALERGAMRLRSWLAGSRTLAAAVPWLGEARGRAGHVLVAAAVTHLILMIAAGRLHVWQFAILPLLVLSIGAVLIATSARTR